MPTARTAQTRTMQALTLALLSSLLIGCAGDGTQDPCSALAAAVCAKACECVPAGAADNDCCFGSSTGNTRCYSRNMCTTAYTRDLCDDPTKTATLFTSCDATFAQTECATEQEPFARLPTACDELLVCNEGPCTQ